MKSALRKTITVAGLTVTATPALAHTGGDLSGFAAGVAHPLLGMDHLLAMVAVGVWSAAQPARFAWRGPVLFVALLAAGALAGIGGISVPLVEPGILASVIILGLMITFARVLPAAAAFVAIGGFALLHGHAHGSEAAGALTSYMTGFVLASTALHAAGFSAGRAMAKMRFGLIGSGFAIAIGGLLLAAG